MGFSSKKAGVGCPPPGTLPNPGNEPTPLMSPELAGGSLPLAPLGKPQYIHTPTFYDVVLYNMYMVCTVFIDYIHMPTYTQKFCIFSAPQFLLSDPRE